MLESPLAAITAESFWVSLLRALYTWIVKYIYFLILQAVVGC